MADTYEAGDYAGLTSENLSAYYGYEELSGDKDDDNSEWCFVAAVDGQEIARIPQSKLGVSDRFNCGANLLRGIAILLDTHKLISE